MKMWIRLDVAVRSDPNVAELAERLKIPFAEAVGLCTLVWCAIAEHRPQGNLDGLSISALEKWAGYEPRKGKPSGAFGKAFVDLFVSDDSASGWRDRQGKLVEQAEKDRARKRRGTSTEPPRSFQGNSTVTERNGTERTERNVVPSREIVKSGEDGPDAKSNDPGNSASPLDLLPREAGQFLGQFYEPAFTEKQRDRYRDIMRQLFEVLDPVHPGPKIRGGMRVKARSVEHLQDELRAVMKDPPPDRDLAIVWLLKRLTNPPKGPSVTEAKKREDDAERQLEDRYFSASKRAGVQWAKENPDGYEKIRVEVDAHFQGQSGSFVQMARDAQLTQRCARAAEFPAFEDWREGQQPARATA